MKFTIEPAKGTTESKELEKLKSEVVATRKTTAKELSEVEKNHIRAAEKLSVQEYPIIYPVMATIGYMVRDMEGGNHQAIEFIRAGLPSSTLQTGKNFLYDLVLDFDKLDEDSKQRVDCLDWLARKNKIATNRFLDAIEKGIEEFSRRQTNIMVAAKRPDLAEKIFKDAISEGTKSTQNKSLASRIAGLVQPAKPQVVIDQSSKTVNVDARAQVVSFSDFQKRQDKMIRGRVEGEEEKDYVDAEEVVNE